MFSVKNSMANIEPATGMLYLFCRRKQIELYQDALHALLHCDV